MFPDDRTKLATVSDGRRAFFMGNALVVGVIERVGTALLSSLRESSESKKAGSRKAKASKQVLA